MKLEDFTFKLSEAKITTQLVKVFGDKYQFVVNTGKGDIRIPSNHGIEKSKLKSLIRRASVSHLQGAIIKKALDATIKKGLL